VWLYGDLGAGGDVGAGFPNGQPLRRSVAYHEIAPHIVLMAFLHRVANGGGSIEREYAIGTRRIAIALRYGSVTVGMELKVWRDRRSPAESWFDRRSRLLHPSGHPSHRWPASSLPVPALPAPICPNRDMRKNYPAPHGLSDLGRKILEQIEELAVWLIDLLMGCTLKGDLNPETAIFNEWMTANNPTTPLLKFEDLTVAILAKFIGGSGELTISTETSMDGCLSMLAQGLIASSLDIM
jgi:hypothetical protein